ncbi:PqqD family protein [Sphingomonas humi]|uniref:PqqD family protein n=1 Tax=Sphingomonas humi TaxID=335630 RepID=A0ABP7S902_9SPHN
MTSTYARSPDAMSAEVGDDVVALQATRGFAFGMEGVTAAVWQLLETPRSEDQIVAALLDDYDVDEEQCRAEIRDLLSMLETEGLIEGTTR